jgi:hypothetical protein
LKVASITNVDATQNSFIVEGTISTSGSYPGSGHGDVLSFAGFDQIKSTKPPRLVEVYEQPPAGTAISGLSYSFAPGTTQANGKVEVLVSGLQGAGLQELGNVTYASVGAANINFRAEFPKFG